MKKRDETVPPKGLEEDDLAAFEEWEKGGGDDEAVNADIPEFEEHRSEPSNRPPLEGKGKRSVATPPTPPEEPVQGGGGLDAFDLAPDVPVQVIAVLAKKSITMKELMQFRMGQVVDLNRPPSETVDLIANGKLVARGELVEIDGKLGVRIIKLMQ